MRSNDPISTTSSLFSSAMASTLSNPSSVEAPVPDPMLMLRTRDTRLDGFISDRVLDEPFFTFADVM